MFRQAQESRFGGVGGGLLKCTYFSMMLMQKDGDDVAEDVSIRGRWVDNYLAKNTVFVVSLLDLSVGYRNISYNSSD